MGFGLTGEGICFESGRCRSLQRETVMEPQGVVVEAQQAGEEEEKEKEEMDPEEQGERMKERISDLVKRHRLNELVNLFRMRDAMRLSIGEIRGLYRVMQDKVFSEFGAPLSPSLFDTDISNSERWMEDSRDGPDDDSINI